ncbi:MAG: ImmA/IrrE family metallo-endopeptidase [Ruminococcus sp.]|nr:ImmA/IrrE family metallo-endopeptidase [Ruminococcus sp.]
MSNYLSRAELEEISEGLISVYAAKHRNKVIQSIDIEHFITNFLNLRIEYTAFAESDSGKIGFLADGQTPLLIHQDGRIIPFIFPKDTIVLDKFLLAEREKSRRRFTMAHEASHHILERMHSDTNAARFHTEFDNERVYTQNELAQMFASAEWQADTMGASLLMPKFIVENALAKFTNSMPIKIYGDTTFAKRDKETIRRMAAYLSVSYTALVIRLRGLGMLEYHDISEFISNELQLGGVQ